MEKLDDKICEITEMFSGLSKHLCDTSEQGKGDIEFSRGSSDGICDFYSIKKGDERVGSISFHKYFPGYGIPNSYKKKYPCLVIGGFFLKKRNQGFGTEVLKKLIDYARENNIKSIVLKHIKETDLQDENGNCLTKEDRVNIFKKVGKKAGISKTRYDSKHNNVIYIL
ncbi:MAG: GNAT family N-acetyltransferase [Candidatus Nanoarchaeia archaeon]|nr:GNAT family N-acetyltransferase [Candidatus Nanoarchaeia archaeon]